MRYIQKCSICGADVLLLQPVCGGKDLKLYQDIYMECVSRIPRLKRAEERRLLELCVKGDQDAKTKLLEANLYLVLRIARKYVNSSLSILDLVQEGNIGLIYALEKFDLRKGTEFKTYAVWHIRRSIIRALGNKSRTIRVPVHIFEKHLRLKKYVESYRQKFGTNPSMDDLAEYSGFSKDKIRLIYDSLQGLVSLNSGGDDGDDSFSLLEAVPDASCVMPEDNVARKELRAHLMVLLQGLSERERNIIQLYYGLATEQLMTLKELSEVYNLTKERIRQIKVEALDKIKASENIEKLRDSLE